MIMTMYIFSIVHASWSILLQVTRLLSQTRKPSLLFAKALKMKESAATVREPTARVTRARAAASQSSERLLILDSTKQQGQKRDLRKNSKRVALEEQINCAATNQHKRRAVLKDVTNVSQDNLNTNCSNASKIAVLDPFSDFVVLFNYEK